MVVKAMGLSVEQLLNAISSFLNGEGGIKSEDDCVKFHNCMKQIGKSAQNVCTYLNIINATDDSTLDKLLTAGAWETLYEWLSDYKELDETPVLVLLLETFQRLPVTMEMLKSNSTAKIIKSLRKHPDEDLKVKAADTVDKWMQLIKAKTGTSSSSTPSERNGEHKEKEKKKKRHKISAEKSEDKIVDIPADRDVPSPPPPSIFKETPKTNSDRTERTTTKQHNVKERSAGVEAGVIKPKPRGSKPLKPAPTAAAAAAEDPSSVSKSSSSNNNSSLNGSHPLSSHKRVNIDIPGISELIGESKKPKIDINKEEDFGKAKLIAPLPKPAHVVTDSDGFMAALLQPRTPLVKKRRSAQSKTPTSPTEKSSPPSTPISPVSAPPSFYKDTLEGPSGASPPHPGGMDTSDRMSPVESTVSSHSEENKPEPMDTSTTETEKVAGGKKKVSWKPEKELRQFYFFELLEDERVNVNRVRDQGGFGEMKKREMLSESAAMKNIHMDHEKGLMKHSNALPTVTEKFTWRRPGMLDLPLTCIKVDPGFLSKERQIQITREISVLAAIYFSKASMPSSASEPDHSSDADVTGTNDQTKTIPLEVVNDLVSAQPAPDTYVPTGVPPPVLAPPISTVLASSGGVGDTMATVADLVPGVTANDMDLIQKLAKGEGGNEILEALANTSSDYLHQIMQTEGISPIDPNVSSGSIYSDTFIDGIGYMAVPPPLMNGPPPVYNHEIRPLLDNNQMRGGYHYPQMPGRGWRGGRGGGPRPPFRGGGPGGFRGGWRGRGVPRGGGPRGGGPRGGNWNRECHHFQKLGKCDYGSECSFLHTR